MLRLAVSAPSHRTGGKLPEGLGTKEMGSQARKPTPIPTAFHCVLPCDLTLKCPSPLCAPPPDAPNMMLQSQIKSIHPHAFSPQEDNSASPLATASVCKSSISGRCAFLSMKAICASSKILQPQAKTTDFVTPNKLNVTVMERR